jgi:flagellar FliL protein
MADAAIDGNVVAAAPKSKLPKLLLFIGAPIVLLAVVVAGLYFAGFGSMIGLGPAEKPKAEANAVKPPAFFDLPEMLVNVNAGPHRTGFLKIAVTLQVADATMIPRVQAVLPRILDNFQTYLRELRIEDLKGSAGLYRLREELLLRVNAAAAPAKITDVLFKEILVQG